MRHRQTPLKTFVGHYHNWRADFQGKTVGEGQMRYAGILKKFGPQRTDFAIVIDPQRGHWPTSMELTVGGKMMTNTTLQIAEIHSAWLPKTAEFQDPEYRNHLTFHWKAVNKPNAVAIAGLARAHLALGEVERAREILALAPAAKANDPAILAAKAQIELAEASADAGETAELQAALERNPDDHQARYDLAMALVGEGDAAGAIDTLLDLFRRDREWNDGAAKSQLFKIFDSLGPKSEEAMKGRRRLSSMIFA
jgi:tetratricopeptide (TPR) repeat protein